MKMTRQMIRTLMAEWKKRFPNKSKEFYEEKIKRVEKKMSEIED